MTTLDTDSEGFLNDPAIWTEDIAAELAKGDQRDLLPEHLHYINEARRMYDENGVVPPLRKFCKSTGTSKQELYDLFQMGPMKLICKWGGLPKPTGCV